jgi:hypothetical protein
VSIFYLAPFYTLYQFVRDIGAFYTHDAFLGTPIAQQIDATVPHDLLIHNRKFLVDIGFENDIGSTIC